MRTARRFGEAPNRESIRPDENSRHSVGRGMKATSVMRLARRGGAILALFFAYCHTTPGAAHAACNHVVRSISDRTLDWNQLDRLIVGDSSALSWDDSLYPSQFPARRPCSGPSCSSRNPVSSSTGVQTTGGFDHWGNLSAAFVDQIDIATEPTGHTASPRSVGGSASIFHPPPYLI